MCLPNHLQGAHKCVEKVSRSNCPVCQVWYISVPPQPPPGRSQMCGDSVPEQLAGVPGRVQKCASSIPCRVLTNVWRKSPAATARCARYRTFNVPPNHLQTAYKCVGLQLPGVQVGTCYHIMFLPTTPRALTVVRRRWPLIPLHFFEIRDKSWLICSTLILPVSSVKCYVSYD